MSVTVRYAGSVGGRKRAREDENGNANICLNSEGSIAETLKKQKTAYSMATALNETIRSQHEKKGGIKRVGT